MGNKKETALTWLQLYFFIQGLMLEDNVSSIESTYMGFLDDARAQYPDGVPAPAGPLPTFGVNMNGDDTLPLLDIVDGELRADELSAEARKTLRGKVVYHNVSTDVFQWRHR